MNDNSILQQKKGPAKNIVMQPLFLIFSSVFLYERKLNNNVYIIDYDWRLCEISGRREGVVEASKCRLGRWSALRRGAFGREI